jgi:hypothetical protein
MIVVLLNVYLVILFILMKLRIVHFNVFWKISSVVVLLLLVRLIKAQKETVGLQAGSGEAYRPAPCDDPRGQGHWLH